MQADILFRSDPVADPASTATFADIMLTDAEGKPSMAAFRALTSGPISANLKNTGANSIDYQVLGANDKNAAAADRKSVVASASLAAGASVHIEIAVAYYAFYWFQQKDTTGPNHGAAHLVGRHARRAAQ